MANEAGRVVCLLPVRDAENDLPLWFESVARFADAVVALDDGSTDRTVELLDAHPLAEIVLRNPPRDGYAGWNDSINRNRLLAAACALDPTWIMQLDADELIPPEDGDALRRFILEQAVPDIAYGFFRYRMVGDLQHFDRLEDRAYRLFAYRPEHRFADQPLHFMPVPTSIPTGRWLATDLRIQHLCWLTPERQRARRQKYREADPGVRWEDDYSYLDAPPGPVHRWLPRRSNAPVVLTPHPDVQPDDRAADELDLDGPVVSVVVVVDEDQLDAMLGVIDAVDSQETRYPFETIVVARNREVADDVARLRPGAIVLAVEYEPTTGACRNAGLRAARGDYVLFLDGPATLSPGALDALAEVHDRGHAVVTGETADPVPTATAWASWFLDHCRASFAREALVAAGGFDEDLSDGLDGLARDRLVAQGHRVAHSTGIVYGHRSEISWTGEYLGQRFMRGRSCPGDLLTIVRGDTRHVADAAQLRRGPFRRVRPLVVAGLVASWCGAVRPRSRRRRG